MNIIFTVCTNSYLAQASILRQSIKQFEANSIFIIILCDIKNPAIDYTNLADEIIEIHEIEPEINKLSLKYDVIELNTAVKPRVIEYLFEERDAAKVIYLDPDIKLYSGLDEVYQNLENFSIVLTPHIYSPVPIDGKTPGENIFLNYGLYNLGFIGLRNDSTSLAMAKWWKNRTYLAGYNNVANGLFVDQLPINHVPIFFSHVLLSKNQGMNVAPWNLHERYLSIKEHTSFVNDKYPLVFFHFSSFTVDSEELPLRHYDRFRLCERPDIQYLYSAYNEEMKANKYFFYQSFESFYTLKREAALLEKKWLELPFYKKLFKHRKKFN